MSAAQIIFTILLVLASIVIIISVLLQKGDADGAMNAMTGGSGSFFGKNKNKTFEGKLSMITKVSASVFVVLALVMIFIK